VGHTCIDAMSAFLLGMMHPPGFKIHLAADKGVVSVTVCTLVTMSLFGIAEVGASCENQGHDGASVRCGVSPGHIMLGCLS